VDSVETASAFRLEVHPAIDAEAVLHAESRTDPCQEGGFEQLIAVWMPLTIALNPMNRSMGVGDLYPFVISPTVCMGGCRRAHISCGARRP
jgi:hypothetical protein